MLAGYSQILIDFLSHLVRAGPTETSVDSLLDNADPIEASFKRQKLGAHARRSAWRNARRH